MSKRSQGINLTRMRKAFALRPLAVGVAAVFLSACGSNREQVAIYKDVDDCVNDNPEQALQCQTAYEDALREAERTGPKYSNMGDCENEFGQNQCQVVRNESGSFFMPFMAGYMLSNLLSPNRYYSQPMYTSYSRYSPLRYRWIGADGYDFGDVRRKKMRVSSKSLKAKPTVTRTIKRGGFGSSVRAKSNWSKSRSSRSWGG